MMATYNRCYSAREWFDTLKDYAEKGGQAQIEIGAFSGKGEYISWLTEDSREYGIAPRTFLETAQDVTDNEFMALLTDAGRKMLTLGSGKTWIEYANAREWFEALHKARTEGLETMWRKRSGDTIEWSDSNGKVHAITVDHFHATWDPTDEELDALTFKGWKGVINSSQEKSTTHTTFKSWKDALDLAKAYNHTLIEISDPFNRTIGFTDQTIGYSHIIGIIALKEAGDAAKDFLAWPQRMHLIQG